MLKLTPFMTLIIKIHIKIFYCILSHVFYILSHLFLNLRTDAVGYNLKRVNYHEYYSRNTLHSLYLFMRFTLK